MRLPNGTPLVNASDISIELGERVLVSGPSGSGKSTLFRALAGVWPFGEGTITVPKDARVMILPQRPYFPIAPLAAAVAYPAEPGSFDAGKVARVDRRGRPARARRPHRGGGALEPHAVARRAATARHRARAALCAGLSVPRRGDRFARRAGRGRALSVAASSGLPTRPSSRSATARHLRHSISAGSRSTAKAITTPCKRRILHRRARAKSADRQRERAATGRGRRPFGTDLQFSLLQAAERQVGRQLGDEGRTAPAGAWAELIAVTLDVPVAVGSLVKALQSPLFRSVSL